MSRLQALAALPLSCTAANSKLDDDSSITQNLLGSGLDMLCCVVIRI